MYYLYIARSSIDNGSYIGTTENVQKRIGEHNQGKTKSLRHRIPIILVHHEKYSDKTEARKRELQLKKNYQIRKELLSKLGFSVK